MSYFNDLYKQAMVGGVSRGLDIRYRTTPKKAMQITYGNRKALEKLSECSIMSYSNTVGKMNPGYDRLLEAEGLTRTSRTGNKTEDAINRVIENYQIEGAI